MGVISYIACKECKVTRNLGKFYTYHIKSRQEALNYAHELASGTEGECFCEVLAVTFLAEHKGHNVVLFDEHSDLVEDFNPAYDNDYRPDPNFWREPKAI